jgi:hypothetical protein
MVWQIAWNCKFEKKIFSVLSWVYFCGIGVVYVLPGKCNLEWMSYLRLSFRKVMFHHVWKVFKVIFQWRVYYTCCGRNNPLLAVFEPFEYMGKEEKVSGMSAGNYVHWKETLCFWRNSDFIWAIVDVYARWDILRSVRLFAALTGVSR